MKKITVIILALGLSLPAKAQISILPELGINFTGITSKFKSGNNTTTIKGKMAPGFRAGLGVGIPLSNHLSVQPGLYYDYGRTNFDLASLGNANLSAKMSLQSLQIPVSLLYHFGEQQDGFFVGAGPYGNFYLSGKKDDDFSFNGNTSLTHSSEVKFGNSNSDDMKPFDLGASFTLGYQLTQGFSIRAFFNLGLSNLKPKGDSDDQMKSKVFGVNLGYRF